MDITQILSFLSNSRRSMLLTRDGQSVRLDGPRRHPKGLGIEFDLVQGEMSCQQAIDYISWGAKHLGLLTPKNFVPGTIPTEVGPPGVYLDSRRVEMLVEDPGMEGETGKIHFV